MKKIFQTFLIALLFVPIAVGLSSCDYDKSNNKVNVVNVYNTNPADTTHTDTVDEMFNYPDISGLKWALIGDYGHGEDFPYQSSTFTTPAVTHTGDHSMFLGKDYGIWMKNGIKVKSGDTLELSFWRYTGGNSFVWEISYSTNGGANWTNLGDPITSSDNDWVKIERTINFTTVGEAKMRIISTSSGKTTDGVKSAFIDDVTYTHTTKMPSFKAGERLTLTSAIFPSYATSSGVSYEIKIGFGSGTTASGATLLSGNVLTADTPGLIQLRPYAFSQNHEGGVSLVYGDYFFVKVM